MKKTFCNIVIAVMVACMLLSLCGCETVHVHKLQEEWTSDQTHHWKVCDDCQGISKKDEHDWDGGTNISDFEKQLSCTKCGYQKIEIFATPHSKGLQIEEVDGVVTVVSMGSCTDTEVVIPATYQGRAVTCIGLKAFFEKATITSVVLPSSITKIDTNAFYGCTSLKNLTIPEGVQEIGVGAFAYCSSLESANIPNSVTELGMGQFTEYSNLKNVTLGNGFTELGTFFFLNCTSLEFVKLPSGITNIGSFAFSDCSNLQSIVIGSSLQDVDAFVFKDATNITNVYYEGTPEQWEAIDVRGKLFYDDCSPTIYYYSETQPTNNSYPCWYYSENGEIALWQ